MAPAVEAEVGLACAGGFAEFEPCEWPTEDLIIEPTPVEPVVVARAVLEPAGTGVLLRGIAAPETADLDGAADREGASEGAFLRGTPGLSPSEVVEPDEPATADASFRVAVGL